MTVIHPKTSVINIFIYGFFKNKEQNELLIAVYCRTNRPQEFLHHKFANPKSFVESIAYIQAPRLKKNCTETWKLTKHLKELKQGHNEALPNMKEIINKHWHLLQINPNHKNWKY